MMYLPNLALIKDFHIFGLRVTFYALFIVSGALLAWFLASWKAHKKGYPWDIYDTVFYWAFPAGIVGSRLWYVIAQWDEFANRPWYHVFETWEGGMAIQGGVTLGAIAGILVILIRRRGWSVWEAADIAVPGILLAQAIGRWGNFFNVEVYGQIVDMSTWSFLPKWILNQMVVDNAFRVPLFLLEGVINIGGYFLLSRFIPLVFNKHYKNGDTLFGYFAWYGIVRFALEPLRDAAYNMGDGSFMAAQAMAIVFMAVGVVGIILNHLARYYLEQRKTKSVKNI
ncbi:MAG: prolipoprotein diacylglyceryl transferase [Bacilli bacterium]|nr:prolipoprotein diacylglyceryl transferase [Bacilli bacterium]